MQIFGAGSGGAGYSGFGEPGFVAGVRRRTSGEVLVRQMDEVDLERILDLRTVVRWSADPEAFGLLRGMRDARWAVAETPGNEGAGVVGMVGAVPLGPVGILCHLAVHDSYRRSGLGASLSRWAVTYLRSRGVGVVRLDSTAEAESLYGRLGFEATLRRAVYRMPEPFGRDPEREATWFEEPERYRVSTLTVEDLPEVYGLDRWSFGGDRSALILAAIRLHPGRGLVARDASGRVKGYLVRSVSGEETRLGPFLAEGDGAAAALLGAALRAVREAGGGPVEISSASPAGSRERGFLESSGFTAIPDRLRMELELGRPAEPGLPVTPDAPAARAGPPGLREYGTTAYLAT